MASTGKVRARRGHLAAAVHAVVNGIVWADRAGRRRAGRAAVVDPLESRVFLSTSALPAWLAPSSAATWDADTHALNVTGTATIVADPGSDEPLVTVTGAAGALTIQPATDAWIHLGSLTLTSGGSAELTRPSAGAFTESGSLVLELGTAGTASTSPLLSVDASAGGTLGIEDNDLIVRGAENYAQDFLRSVDVQASGIVPPGGVALDPSAYHADGLILPGWSADAGDWSVEDRTLRLAPGDVLAKYTPLGHDDAASWTNPDAPATAPAAPSPSPVREQIGPAYPAAFFASSFEQPALASGPTPASVSSVVVNGNDPDLLGPQRSMVDDLLYTFSEPVTLDPTNAFTINVQPNQPGTAPTLAWTAVNPDAGGAATMWAVTFTGPSVINRSIANGVYSLALNTAYVTSKANPGLPAAAHNPDLFFRLYGDADGNGTVDGTSDYAQFQQSLSTYNPIFDFYGTGNITALDYSQFKHDLNVTYPGTISFNPAALRPTNLTATTDGPTSVTLAWTGPSDPTVNGYTVQRWSDADPTWTTLPGNPLPASPDTFTDWTVVPGHTYEYALAAQTTLGLSSDWSLPSNDAATPTQVDVGLTATAVSASEIDLAWTGTVPNATAIQVQVSTDGTTFSPVVPSLDPTALQYQDTNLPENSLRAYQLDFQVPGGDVVAGPVFAYTLPAVDGLSAVAVSDTQVTLTWASYAPDATGFELDRSTDGGQTWTALPPVPAGQLSYTDTGLTPDTDYTYRVAALRPGGTSQYAGPADAYTLPSAIGGDGGGGGGGLTATANGTGEIDLSWTAADPNLYGFDLQRSDDGGQTFETIANLDPGTTTYADTDVLDGTTYYYQLLATNASGESAPSAVASATTDLAVPSGLVATPLAGQGIQLAWVGNSATSTGFTVSRSTDGQAFTTVTLDANGIDASAVTGQSYYYSVIATNDTTSSKPSDPVQATDTPADINAIDDTPASGVNYSVTHGKTLTITAANLLANDIDPNTSPTLSIKSFTNPSGGTLTDNHDGTLTYKANTDFVGTDAFTYTPTDQYGASSNAATVQIQVTDQMPEASSGRIGVVQARDANGNWLNYPATVHGTLVAYDADGDPLTFSATMVSGEGTFSLDDSSTGAYTFTPSQSYQGEVLIVFTASDGVLASNKASLIFPGWSRNNADPDDAGSGDNDGDEVIAATTLPYAGNTHYRVDQDRILSVPANGVLSEASDADDTTSGSDGPTGTDTDGDSPAGPTDLQADADLIESPQHGTAQLNGDGSFTYTPDPGFTGRDWFTWQVDDSTMHGDYASAFIDVQPTPQPAVTLTVGDYSDPALPGLKQDTPFVPVDDGYASDTQLVPNNKLSQPDPADPELVPASVTLAVPNGQSATWSLSFTDPNLRVFVVQPSTGSLIQIRSGQQFTYDPGGTVDVSSTQYQFEVQGVLAGDAVPITAMLTPAGATQSAQANVNVNVGKPLQVLSVNDNAPGSILTPAQVQAGVFLPISNPVLGLRYRLPLDISDLQVTAALQVPKGWTLINGITDFPVVHLAAGGQAILLPTASQDVPYFLEDDSTAPSTAGVPVQISLNQIRPDNKVGGSLGKFSVTPFIMSTVGTGRYNGAGPTDVPQYGWYEYKVAPLKGGVDKWLDPDSGRLKVPGGTLNDVQIQWIPGADGAAFQGEAAFEANAQYIWQMPVNVMTITATATNPFSTTGTVTAKVGVAEGATSSGLFKSYLTVQSSLITWQARVTVAQPDAPLHGGGAAKLRVGFAQSIHVSSFGASYGAAAPGTPFAVALVSTGQYVQATPEYWDTVDRPGLSSDAYPDKFYYPKAIFDPSSQTMTKLLATSDQPFASVPRSYGVKGGQDLQSTTLDWDLTTFVAAITSESASVYAAQALATWSFNGTGTFNAGNQTWTGPTAAVLPPNPNSWVAADENSQSPVTTGIRFNDLAEGNYTLKPA